MNTEYLMNNICRHRAVHGGWSAGGGVAGGPHWPGVHPEDERQPQEPGLHSQPGLHLRAGERRVRPGPHAGPAPELHLPVPPGHQEADQEVRTEYSPLSLHLSEPLPEVLL